MLRKLTITVQMTSCLTSLDLSKQIKLLFIQQRKAVNFKQNKHVSRTVILPLKLVFSDQCIITFL